MKGSDVLQFGPRNLWEEVETAFFRWVSHDSPSRDRFGLTVTPDGQHLWLDTPANRYGRPFYDPGEKRF